MKMHAWMWKHCYALSRVPYLHVEYFADEKPLRMSQMSRKIDLTIAIWQGSCVITSANLGFAILFLRSSQCLMLANFLVKR